MFYLDPSKKSSFDKFPYYNNVISNGRICLEGLYFYLKIKIAVVNDKEINQNLLVLSIH